MAYWDKLGTSGNVEDRRGASPLLLGGGGLGIAGVVLTLLFNVLTGAPTDLGSALNQLQQSQALQSTGQSAEFEGLDNYEKFASTVLGSTNETWRTIFSQSSLTYNEPKLVLFRNLTSSGCGTASSDVGPHYCPADSTIYLDETFFDELTERFGAQGGDVAQAYVIAHEVGHHVQNELGTMEAVEGTLRSSSPQSNATSIKLELQADCFAGIWAHSIRGSGVFEQGEIAEAIDAAAAVGDDRIQESIQGRVSPESWTHGSSAQRVEWFNRGYVSGRASDCNTFRT